MHRLTALHGRSFCAGSGRVTSHRGPSSCRNEKMKRCRIELVSEGAKWPMTHMSACLGLFALGRPGQLVASQPFITTGNISFLSAMPAGSLASPLATRVSTWVAWPMTVILRPS